MARVDLNIKATSVTISEGYQAINEVAGHTTAGTECVVMGNFGREVSVSGHVAKDATIPKNGDTVTVTGYDIAWIDGVSLAKTPDGVAAFSATVHARKPNTAIAP